MADVRAVVCFGQALAHTTLAEGSLMTQEQRNNLNSDHTIGHAIYRHYKMYPH